MELRDEKTVSPDGEKRRVIMKKILFALVLVLFTAPTAVLADVGIDYKTKCAACHGANANLLPKTARLLNVDPKKLALRTSQMNKEEMIAIIEKGKDKMPSFEKDLTKDKVNALVDFLMSLRKK
jgi:cytochrome c5